MFDHAADDDLALRIGLLDLVPNLHFLGFFAREDDVAFAIFRALEEHVDDVAGLDRYFAVLVQELVDRDDAFGLVADVDDHFRRGDFQNGSLDDLAFRDVSEAVIVDVQELGVLVRIDLVVFVSGPDFESASVAARGALGTFAAFAGRDSASGTAARTGNVLVVYVRHAFRVLISGGRMHPVRFS